MAKIRQLQKEATRKRIIKAAYRVYGQQGFSASTQIIAKEAGVSHGSIFVHFSTREELISYLMEDFFGRLGEQLHHMLREGSGLEDILRAHLELIQENECFYTALVSQLPDLPKHTAEEVIAFQSILSLHVSQAMAGEQEEGLIKDVPLHMLFHTWIGLIHYYLQNRPLFAPNGSVLEARKEELITTYLILIRT